MPTHFDLPPALPGLAQLFCAAGRKLYLVGGFVRDTLLGRPSCDIDVCSDLAPDAVCRLLEASAFMIPQSNMPLGTLIIVSGDFKCEYTCFRTESYRPGGGHAPESVAFPASMAEDALRRDFTVNALYYDIGAGRVIDPLKTGLGDLARRVVRTTRDPHEVFGEDPLRIMRLCRIAGALGFDIDSPTLAAAAELAHTAASLTRHRIGDELFKLLEGGGAGLTLLYDTGAAAVVSPCIKRESCRLADGAGFEPAVALAVLFTGCDPERANGIMRGLAVPAATADLASFLIRNAGYQSAGNALKLDIAMMGASKARCLAAYLHAVGSAFAASFEAALSELLASGAPMSLQELKLTGRQIMESLRISPGPDLGAMLQRAFCHAVRNPSKNNARDLIQYLSNGLDE